MHKRRFSASLKRTGDRQSILSSDWSEGRREHSHSLTSSLNEWCGAERICVLFAVVVLFSIKTEGTDDRYMMKKKACGGDGTWQWFLTLSEVASGCRFQAANRKPPPQAVPGPSRAGGKNGGPFVVPFGRPWCAYH